MIPILLVDDHPAICFALKITLEKKGDFCVSSSNGERLLQQIHQSTPDLLLLDLELNGSDGLDMLPRIKQHFPDLKILIFSNQPAGVYARRTLEAGADGFVNKNIDLDELDSICRLILANYHFFPADVMDYVRKKMQTPQTQENLLSCLSDRELTVLQYLRRGKTNKQIADILLLSHKTISTYKARMLEKCNVENIDILLNLLEDIGTC
ncbi:response regulator transcription factor [Scandinavium goeteborgense]|uniref:LuxR family two component transcriptional regulator n=1 Tax=Scandinavium goeteborgense TaxID=1851514 RepID=A0A4R6E179_SCAGO|nr:response regulator transcription factor [Scandinavium goeteborgense]TDN51475.1 LuxR family two component transcriptional regulator [Scandinavium goeteborgense]